MVILATMLVLVACNEDLFEVENSVPMGETNGIKISLSIARNDSFGGTKATVKTDWADNDVIFVFFKGITAPKYLEIKYNEGEWTCTAKNGLNVSDFSGATEKKMTAIYLPYGGAATVAASEGNFIFSDMTYSGYFLKAEQVDYTFDDNVLSGSLSMIAPTLSNNSDKLIHFDISGFTSGHDYKFYQDYVKPLTFTSVSADGVISKNEGAMGTAITGYEDGSMMSFSGILDASAVGNAVDYQFSIDDLTSSILYTRDAGTKTLSASKYIGIGAINDTQKWNAFEYVDLGLSVRWAKCNVGASTPEEYGDYYAWGATEPYYEPGYAQENPQNHWKTGFSDGYIWADYKFRSSGNKTREFDNLKLSKYVTIPRYGTVDEKSTLDLEDDVAHVKWNGKWRIPTNHEQSELAGCSTKWVNENGIYGILITSNRSGYEGRSIFLPASGGYSYIETDNSFYTETDILKGLGSSVRYWSSSLASNSPSYADILAYEDIITNFLGVGSSPRCYGNSIRPVFPLDNRELVTSINVDKNDLLMAVNETYKLITAVMIGDEIVDYPITWLSDNPSVATVSQEGLITAISEGTATITALYRNKSASCSVVVEHELVDLGLSVKWASYNVGATMPEECGGYYAWGEIETKSDYSWSTYKFGTQYNITKYNDDEENGDVDNKYELEPEDDVAQVSWGGNWRMPTSLEYYELMRDCNWSWTSLNGVNGYLVTSKKTGYTNRSIFLPAAGFHSGSTGVNSLGSYGFYWTSSHQAGGDNQYESYRMGFNSSWPDYETNWRNYGGSIRPVHP